MEAGPAPSGPPGSAAPAMEPPRISREVGSGPITSKRVPEVDDFQCAICSDLLLDPVVCGCGHDYCKGCLDQWRRTCEQAAASSALLAGSSGTVASVCCPICRAEITQPYAVCQRVKAWVEAWFPEQIEQRRREARSRMSEVEKRSQQLLALQRACIARLSSSTSDDGSAPPLSQHAQHSQQQHSPSVLVNPATWLLFNNQPTMAYSAGVSRATSSGLVYPSLPPSVFQVHGTAGGMSSTSSLLVTSPVQELAVRDVMAEPTTAPLSAPMLSLQEPQGMYMGLNGWPAVRPAVPSVSAVSPQHPMCGAAGVQRTPQPASSQHLPRRSSGPGSALPPLAPRRHGASSARSHHGAETPDTEHGARGNGGGYGGAMSAPLSNRTSMSDPHSHHPDDTSSHPVTRTPGVVAIGDGIAPRHSGTPSHTVMSSSALVSPAKQPPEWLDASWSEHEAMDPHLRQHLQHLQDALMRQHSHAPTTMRLAALMATAPPMGVRAHTGPVPDMPRRASNSSGVGAASPLEQLLVDAEGASTFCGIPAVVRSCSVGVRVADTSDLQFPGMHGIPGMADPGQASTPHAFMWSPHSPAHGRAGSVSADGAMHGVDGTPHPSDAHASAPTFEKPEHGMLSDGSMATAGVGVPSQARVLPRRHASMSDASGTTATTSAGAPGSVSRFTLAIKRMREEDEAAQAAGRPRTSAMRKLFSSDGLAGDGGGQAAAVCNIVPSFTTGNTFGRHSTGGPPASLMRSSDFVLGMQGMAQRHPLQPRPSFGVQPMRALSACEAPPAAHGELGVPRTSLDGSTGRVWAPGGQPHLSPGANFLSPFGALSSAHGASTATSAHAAQMLPEAQPPSLPDVCALSLSSAPAGVSWTMEVPRFLQPRTSSSGNGLNAAGDATGTPTHALGHGGPALRDAWLHTSSNGQDTPMRDVEESADEGLARQVPALRVAAGVQRTSSTGPAPVSPWPVRGEAGYTRLYPMHPPGYSSAASGATPARMPWASPVLASAASGPAGGSVGGVSRIMTPVPITLSASSAGTPGSPLAASTPTAPAHQSGYSTPVGHGVTMSGSGLSLPHLLQRRSPVTTPAPFSASATAAATPSILHLASPLRIARRSLSVQDAGVMVPADLDGGGMRRVPTTPRAARAVPPSPFTPVRPQQPGHDDAPATPASQTAPTPTQPPPAPQQPARSTGGAPTHGFSTGRPQPVRTLSLDEAALAATLMVAGATGVVASPRALAAPSLPLVAALRSVLSRPDLSRLGPTPQPWHAGEADRQLRSSCSSALVGLFTERYQAQMEEDGHPRSNMFMYVTVIEELLYGAAPTKAHYADLSTLHERMVQAVEQLIARQAQQDDGTQQQ